MFSFKLANCTIFLIRFFQTFNLYRVLFVMQQEVVVEVGNFVNFTLQKKQLISK